MAFKYGGVIGACRSHLRNILATKFKFGLSQVSRVSSKAGDNPLNPDLNSWARDDGRSNQPDTTEAVKDGIRNVVDTAEAIGENTKEAAETVWDIAKDGAETVKEKIRDSGKPQPGKDVTAATESSIRGGKEKALA